MVVPAAHAERAIILGCRLGPFGIRARPLRLAACSAEPVDLLVKQVPGPAGAVLIHQASARVYRHRTLGSGSSSAP